MTPCEYKKIENDTMWKVFSGYSLVAWENFPHGVILAFSIFIKGMKTTLFLFSITM